MARETAFLVSIIGKAERRLLHQARMLETLPHGSASAISVRECEVFQIMSSKVAQLRRTSERLAASRRADRSI